MRVAFVSVPFRGHANRLRDIFQQFLLCDPTVVTSHWFMVSWRNEPMAILKEEPFKHGSNSTTFTILETNEPRRSMDPLCFTFSRALALLPLLLEHLSCFNPNLVVYDFFCPEALVAARVLGAQTWCSVPALLGPHSANQLMAQYPSFSTFCRNELAMTDIEARYGVALRRRMESASDALFFPGDTQLVWHPAEICGMAESGRGRNSLHMDHTL